MDSSTIAHDLRAKEWRQIILEANNSDIPKSQYIRDHHLSENSFLPDEHSVVWKNGMIESYGT